MDSLVDQHKKIFTPENGSSLRLLHYPPIPNHLLDTDDVTRCGAHTDYGMLTFLYHDDIHGLEVIWLNFNIYSTSHHDYFFTDQE